MFQQPSDNPDREREPRLKPLKPDLDTGQAFSRRRWRLALTSVVVLLLVIGSLWWLGSRLTTPEQRAADASPPPASPVVVPVEQRVLSDTVIVRGDVKPSEHGLLDVEWRGSLDGGVAVVSAPLPEQGDEISEGDVVAEVSGRPIFLMEGAVPLWRELEPGDEGSDVALLQAFLVRLGATIDDEAGHFGHDTASAVADLYRSNGYPVRIPEGLDFGTTVPFGEILVIEATPAYVATVASRIGSQVEGPILTLASSELIVESLLDAAAASLVEVGAHVVLSAEATGATAAGTVISVASTPQTTDDGRSGYRTVIAADEGLDPTWLGLNVRVTIADTESGDLALVVPESALYAQAGGVTRVVVQLENGSYSEVEVEVKLTAGGFAAVSSANEILSEGALVVVSGDWRSASTERRQ